MKNNQKTQTQIIKNKFSVLLSAYNEKTGLYARKFIVALCWVGYYTAATMAVVLFVPGLLVKATKLAYKVITTNKAK